MKISFDRTKPYNQLPLLPPARDIIDEKVLLQWGYASRNLAEMNRNLLRLPNPSMLINTISLLEAKSSSEVENIFTTLDELYKAVSDTVKEENSSPAVKEVLRYKEALWTGYNLLKQKKKEISLEMIIRVYQEIKNTSQGLRSPQSQVVIKRGNSELRPGEIIYTPPRGTGILKSYMDNLTDYLKDNQSSDPDALIKMAVFNYQFEAIHPFSDGNGRTGRIINLLYLVNRDLLSLPVLYLSKYIIDNKEEYYYRLSAVTQRSDWKRWILFMLEAVKQTAAYTNRLIDDIIGQMDSTYDYAKNNLKWYSKEVNETLFSQPYTKQGTIGKILDRTSRTTLTGYMKDLTKLGILSPLKDGREVYYLNNDLIRILEG